jgi:hypothetical protein
MKHIMKIRLRQDGTWENVYDDESTQLSNKTMIKMQNALSELAADYLEQAVEASGYRDAKEVINYIRGLK